MLAEAKRTLAGSPLKVIKRWRNPGALEHSA